MHRSTQAQERQLSRPKTYSELKEDPFPYLEQSNREEIFEFIREIQAENQRLRADLTAKFPGKTIEESMEQHELLQAKRRLMAINRESIEEMEIQIQERAGEVEELQRRNAQLEVISVELVQSFTRVENKLIEAEKEKRFLEMKMELQRERAAKAVDLSSIFNNLYKDVKDTLNDSL